LRIAGKSRAEPAAKPEQIQGGRNCPGSGLWDENASGWAGPICARAQFSLQLFQEILLTLVGANVPHGHPVDPSGACASIRSGVPPGAAERADVG